MQLKKIYQLTVEETMEKYGLQDTEGLSKQQAAQRLAEVGLNQLVSKKTPKWRLLLRQFNNLIIYILIFSALLTRITVPIMSASERCPMNSVNSAEKIKI